MTLCGKNTKDSQTKCSITHMSTARNVYIQRFPLSLSWKNENGYIEQLIRNNIGCHFPSPCDGNTLNIYKMIQPHINKFICDTYFRVYFNIAIYKHTRFYKNNENATHRIYLASSFFPLLVMENCNRTLNIYEKITSYIFSDISFPSACEGKVVSNAKYMRKIYFATCS